MKKTCNTFVSISLLLFVLACNSEPADETGTRPLDAGVAVDATTVPFGELCKKSSDCSDWSGCLSARCEDGACVYNRGTESLDILTVSGPKMASFWASKTITCKTAQADKFSVFDLANMSRCF